MSKYKIIVDPRLDIKLLRDAFSKEADFLSIVDVAKLLNATIMMADYDEQTLKDFVSELKEHSVKVDNERAVKISMVDRLLIEYTK